MPGSQAISDGFIRLFTQEIQDFVFGRRKPGQGGIYQTVNQKEMIDKKPGKTQCLCGFRRLTKDKNCD